jgi:lipopolysaccharide export system permease protein
MKSNEFVQRFEKRDDLKKVAPGQFRESAGTNRVFFVEGGANASTNNAVQNVFVNTIEKGINTVVVAKEGVIEPDGKGGQFLVLKNGRRYQGTPGLADFQTMEFGRYSMRVATRVPLMGDVSVDSMTTPALLVLPTRWTRAELLWRIASPVMCVVLMLLAIPLGFVNPRAGSSVNLILAVLIFFTYSNLVKLTEASVKQDKLQFAVGWWPIHLAVLLAAIGLFAWRLNVNHRYHPLVLLAAWKRGRADLKGAA